MNNKNNLLFASILSLILSYGCDHNVEDEHAGMRSSEPALRWQDALISGNGSMGILVYGDPENEKIIFNHEFCYEPLGTEDVEPPDMAKYLPKISRLFKEGKYREVHDYSYAMAKKEGYPGLLWTDPYHPAFQMKIDQPKVKPGSMATARPQLVCGPCKRGQYNACQELKVQGFQAPGVALELFMVTEERIVPIPENMTLEQGAMIEPAAVCAHSTYRVTSLKGKNIVVAGAGTIGNLVAQFAKA